MTKISDTLYIFIKISQKNILKDTKSFIFLLTQRCVKPKKSVPRIAGLQ